MSQTSGVSLEDVRRVAELANLELTSEEEPRMQRDLNAILGHIAQLMSWIRMGFRRWRRLARYSMAFRMGKVLR